MKIAARSPRLAPRCPQSFSPVFPSAAGPAARGAARGGAGAKGPMRPPGAPRDVALELPPALSGPAATMGASAAAGLPERLRLPVCFLGVFACYFYYGILQESM